MHKVSLNDDGLTGRRGRTTCQGNAADWSPSSIVQTTAPSLPGLDVGKYVLFFVQKHTLTVAIHKQKLSTCLIKCNEKVQNPNTCLEDGPTGQTTSQGDWPVGACSGQAVRCPAARHTHRRLARLLVRPNALQTKDRQISVNFHMNNLVHNLKSFT